MEKIKIQKTIYSRLILTACLLAFSFPCYGSVIFETTFDNNADWNTNGSLNKDCGSPSCSDAPTNWNNYYAQPPVGKLSTTITAVPGGGSDHTGGTAKKAFMAYYNNVKYSGGQELSKTFAQDYPELYVRVWIKTQIGWKTAADSSIKLWRIGHWDRTGSAFAYFAGGNGAPLAGLNWATNQAYRGKDANYITWARFDPQQSAYTPKYSPFNTDTPFDLTDGVAPNEPGGFADGAWHQYDLHVKMNTSLGSTNGIFEFWYDGKLIVSHKNMSWLMSGSNLSVGWNSIQFGGNSLNSYSGGSNPQWAAFDDIVVSTTPIPSGYVIGGGAPPATIVQPPPNAKGVTY